MRLYCTKCGWRNPDEATKCSSCSADLQGPSPAAPPQPTQYAQQPGYQPQSKQSNTLSIIGIVLGAASLLLCPILFGAAGITLGAIGMSRKEKLGLVAIIVSVCCMLVGIVIGVVVGVARFRALRSM